MSAPELSEPVKPKIGASGLAFLLSACFLFGGDFGSKTIQIRYLTVIASNVERGNQIFGFRLLRIELDCGTLRQQIDRCFLNSRHALQGILNSCGTGSAVHPFHCQV